MNAVNRVISSLGTIFPKIPLTHATDIKLNEVIQDLVKLFPQIEFSSCRATSAMRPDGGVLFILDKDNKPYPILISEKKNQGTNDLRRKEGKPRQAQGNAIERLGKNVIGLRTALLGESIFPFVCFGDGCDFCEDSSIVDRVTTIAMFGHLNKINLYNSGAFNRGSFFFREKEWTEDEMFEQCLTIAKSSTLYYLSKYPDKFSTSSTILKLDTDSN